MTICEPSTQHGGSQMVKDQPGPAVAPISTIPFEERDFTAKQAREILAVGKTRFFQEVLPRLESTFEGARLIISGRSIKAYREFRYSQARQRRQTPRRKPQESRATT
jgi:hypothetical protein